MWHSLVRNWWPNIRIPGVECKRWTGRFERAGQCDHQECMHFFNFYNIVVYCICLVKVCNFVSHVLEFIIFYRFWKANFKINKTFLSWFFKFKKCYLQSKITVMPSTDFYKSVALELTFKQVSVDLFCIGERYMNLATLGDLYLLAFIDLAFYFCQTLVNCWLS